MTFETKDSGKREEYATGSQRDTTEGKGSYISLPPEALKRWAQLMERGAKKYGLFNYMKGQPFSRLFDSAIRHLIQARDGQVDEDHLAAVLFNAGAVMQFQAMIARGELPAELDDLPKLGAATKSDPPTAESRAEAIDLLRVNARINSAMLRHKADCGAFAKAMACPQERPELREGKWLRRDGSVIELLRDTVASARFWTPDDIAYETSDWGGDAYYVSGTVSRPHSHDLIRPAVLATIAHEFEAAAPMTDCPRTLPGRFRENDCGA